MVSHGSKKGDEGSEKRETKGQVLDKRKRHSQKSLDKRERKWCTHPEKTNLNKLGKLTLADKVQKASEGAANPEEAATNLKGLCNTQEAA